MPTTITKASAHHYAEVLARVVLAHLDAANIARVSVEQQLMIALVVLNGEVPLTVEQFARIAALLDVTPTLLLLRAEQELLAERRAA